MTAIYLRCRSPVQLKMPPLRSAPGRRVCLLYGVAPDRVYRLSALPQKAVSSYLAFPPLPQKCGGISLLHFPWGRPRLPLAVILALGARTFLAPFLSETGPLPSFPLTNEYYITNSFICQTAESRFAKFFRKNLNFSKLNLAFSKEKVYNNQR